MSKPKFRQASRLESIHASEPMVCGKASTGRKYYTYPLFEAVMTQLVVAAWKRGLPNYRMLENVSRERLVSRPVEKCSKSWLTVVY